MLLDLVGIFLPEISPWQIVWRVGLLFAIGVCYGLMVFHLQNEGGHNLGGGNYVENIMRTARAKESYNLMYLMFWGFAGVGLGSLLPWIDGLWEEKSPVEGEVADGKQVEPQAARYAFKKNQVLGADWNPVVRSIGVFVGIAFAIRKLAWTSTLQLSLSLTLINPVLWYLVDRSLPGFILSSIIGTFGAFLLLSINPSMMPPPLVLSTSSSFSGSRVPSFPIDGNSSAWDWNTFARDGILKTRYGVLDAQTLEISIWVGSVLFCSAVCFGGIGRRLAIRRSA